MASQNVKAKTACDQCRFRKLKCDGGYPCERCYKMDFDCSFNPRATRNKRVEMLRGRRQQSSPSPGHASEGFSTDLRFPAPTEAQDQTTVDFQGEDGDDQLLSVDDEQSTRPQSMGVRGQSFEVVPSPHAEASDTRHTGQYSSIIALPASPQDCHISQPLFPSRTNSSAVAGNPTTDSSNNQQGASPGFNAASPFSTITAQVKTSSAFSEADVMPWISIFFDRLYPTLPIVNRFSLYRDIVAGRQSQDQDFAAMVLSLSALALVQPVLREEYESMPSRITLATKMLQASMRSRTHTFGENLTVVAVVASFFMFAALFGMGHQNAAWLRLREAVECGKMIGLHRPETYRYLNRDEKGQRFRLFLILSVTERGYALQRNHYISFTGQHLSKMDIIYGEIEASATSQISSILVHDDKDVIAMRGLLQLMKLFDSVDEDVITCWNRSCSISHGTCTKLTTGQVQRVYNAISSAMPPTSSRISHSDESTNDASSAPQPTNSTLNDPQRADCFVLQQWLLIRLWVSCLTHDLLDENSSLHFIKPSFAISVATNVWNECRKLDTSVLEVHGIGMIERLFDVAMGVCMAIEHCQGSEHASITESGVATLEHYFRLLDHLRNGGHTFSSALREAYESIQT